MFGKRKNKDIYNSCDQSQLNPVNATRKYIEAFRGDHTWEEQVQIQFRGIKKFYPVACIPNQYALCKEGRRLRVFESGSCPGK
jgi:hypothetical protein